MQSDLYRIECAKLRHRADFLIQHRDRTRNSSVPPLVDIDLLSDMRFAFLSSTGFSQGDDSSINIDRSIWRRIESDSSIIMRFHAKLFQYFYEKKFISFNFKGRGFSISSLLDLNAENIYLVADIQGVQ